MPVGENLKACIQQHNRQKSCCNNGSTPIVDNRWNTDCSIMLPWHLPDTIYTEEPQACLFQQGNRIDQRSPGIIPRISLTHEVPYQFLRPLPERLGEESTCVRAFFFAGSGRHSQNTTPQHGIRDCYRKFFR